MPTVVKAQKDENKQSLISRFRKIVSRDNVVEEARDRRFYKKPSEIRQERIKARKRDKYRNRSFT